MLMMKLKVSENKIYLTVAEMKPSTKLITHYALPDKFIGAAVASIDEGDDLLDDVKKRCIVEVRRFARQLFNKSSRESILKEMFLPGS